MARTSVIDKRIAELQGEIEALEHAIAVLKSVQHREAKFTKPAKPRTVKAETFNPQAALRASKLTEST